MTTKVQCRGITSKGSQCSRQVVPPKTCCWQHETQAQCIQGAAVKEPVPIVALPPVAAPVVVAPAVIALAPEMKPIPPQAAVAPVVAKSPARVGGLKSPNRGGGRSPPRNVVWQIYEKVGDVFQKLPIDDARPQEPNQIILGNRTFPIDRTKTIIGVGYPKQIQQFQSAYIPILQPLPDDDQFKQKIGGHRPFFLKGDHWPTTQDLTNEKLPKDQIRPLAFVMQFVDPRPNKNELVQVFFPDIDSEEFEANGNPVHLRFIGLDVPFNYIYIPEPANTIKNKGVYDQPQEIKSWLLRSEPNPQFVFDLLQQAGLPEDAFDQVYQQIVPGGLNDTVKIGGYGESTQGIDYTEFIHNLYNTHWGDAGVIHVSQDSKAYGDMA